MAVKKKTADVDAAHSASAPKRKAAAHDPTTRTISLLPYQWEFIAAKEKYVFFCAGIGTGKTHAASAFVVQMVIEQPPETVGFIGAESTRQLSNAVFPALRKAFEAAGIKAEWNEGKNTIKANGRKIIYNTMDEASINSIMGSEIGWFWIDEADYAPLYSVQLVNSRLRCPRATRLLGRYTSSPNGFRVMYDMFVANRDDTRRMIKATTFDNPHLPATYIPDLRKQYTPLQFRQQVMAEFVNLQGGQIYDCFDEEKHKAEFDHTAIHSKIYIGLDFNVAQMCAVAVKFENGRFFVFDEFYLRDSNTIKMSQEIIARFPRYRTDVFIIPDSTFEARSVTSEKTSKEILRRAGFQIMPTRNPYIGERQQAVNNAFWNEGSTAAPKILIHPKCGRLVKELNTLTPDDKEGDVSHLAVALGYVVWKLDPLKRGKRQSRIIQ